MTPEQKAKELVNKFYQPITINLNVHNNSKQMWEHAKFCALIAVDHKLEILAELHQSLCHNAYSSSVVKDFIKEELQVKTEIEKL